MNLSPKYKRAAKNHKAARLQFVLTELDLALTFSQMAVSATDVLKMERNTENALHAYAAARHFLHEDEFPEDLRTGVRERIRKLEPLLLELKRRRNSLARARAAGRS